MIRDKKNQQQHRHIGYSVFDELAQQSHKNSFQASVSGNAQPNLHANSELMTLFVTLIREADDLELDAQFEKTVFYPTAPH